MTEAEKERAAIVKWLNTLADEYEESGIAAASANGNMADEYFSRSDGIRSARYSILCGEHLKGKK